MPKKKRRNKTPDKVNLVSANDALLTALTKIGLTDQVRGLMICQVWSKVVGEQTASNTAPAEFSRGVLRVKAKSSAWQNELTFLKATIIERLNAILGKSVVNEIRVVAGTVSASAKPRAPAWLAASSNTEEKSIAQANSLPIKDNEVRESFEHLMCLHLRALRHRKKSR